MSVIQLSSSSGEKTWYFVELQGTLEVSGDVDEQQSQDLLKVGTLSFDSADPTKCRLVVGNHTLEGKELPLKKPLLVLQKQRDPSSPTVNYVTRHIIRKKLQFKNRPVINV